MSVRNSLFRGSSHCFWNPYYENTFYFYIYAISCKISSRYRHNDWGTHTPIYVAIASRLWGPKGRGSVTTRGYEICLWKHKSFVGEFFKQAWGSVSQLFFRGDFFLLEPGELRRYSDLVTNWSSEKLGFDPRQGRQIFLFIKVHTASCTMGTGSCFPRDKVAGAWSWLLVGRG
jgi:hypothetical protein